MIIFTLKENAEKLVKCAFFSYFLIASIKRVNVAMLVKSRRNFNVKILLDFSRKRIHHKSALVKFFVIAQAQVSILTKREELSI